MTNPPIKMILPTGEVIIIEDHDGGEVNNYQLLNLIKFLLEKGGN